MYGHKAVGWVNAILAVGENSCERQRENKTRKIASEHFKHIGGPSYNFAYGVVTASRIERMHAAKPNADEMFNSRNPPPSSSTVIP